MHLGSDESALLARVNEGLPGELHSRLVVLRTKRENGSITAAEYSELTGLTDKGEELQPSAWPRSESWRS